MAWQVWHCKKEDHCVPNLKLHDGVVLPHPFFVLAPMDDVTDTVFRQIVADNAAPDLYFTEFVNVDGLQSPGRPKLLPKLEYTASEQPIIAQLWGKNPENYFKSAKDLVRMGFAGVDINMGCPAKPIIKNGCCSALINNRELAKEIILATQRGVKEALEEEARTGDTASGQGTAKAPRHFPVSVKTRLGFSKKDYTWHEMLLGTKLNMLTIHGRTTAEMSKVPADWDAIGHIAKLRTSLSPETLIVGNGDVISRSQGLELAEKHGLDGIMIGRGIFHDPFVFSTDSKWLDYTKQQKLDLYTKHVKLFTETWPNNERNIHMLNKFCKVYIEGFPGAKELREKLMNAESAEELLSMLDRA